MPMFVRAQPIPVTVKIVSKTRHKLEHTGTARKSIAFQSIQNLLAMHIWCPIMTGVKSLNETSITGRKAKFPVPRQVRKGQFFLYAFLNLSWNFRIDSGRKNCSFLTCLGSLSCCVLNLVTSADLNHCLSQLIVIV